MPKGWGPFGTMIGFTRWIVSYETVYHKGIPPLAGADSYGGHYRTPKRNPKNYPTVETDPFFIAGIWSSPFRTGTLVPSVQTLSRAYQTCSNPDGQFANPMPLSPICNGFTRSLLTGPFGVNGSAYVPQSYGFVPTFAQSAGSVNPLFAPNLITLGRGVLDSRDGGGVGETSTSAQLFALPRAILRLQEAFAGRVPGSTRCSGNPALDPLGCETEFRAPSQATIFGQGFGAARLLLAALTSGRAPFADGKENPLNEAESIGGIAYDGRHAPWYPLQFDSHGEVFGRNLGRDLTVQDLVGALEDVHASNSDGELLYTQADGKVTTNPVDSGGVPNAPLVQNVSPTLESEFGPSFSSFSADPERYRAGGIGVGAMLFARLDNDRFGDRGGEGNPNNQPGLAIVNETGITESLWGATSFKNSNLGVLTNLDQEITPQGYLRVTATDWIASSEAFIASNLWNPVGDRSVVANGLARLPNGPVVEAQQIGGKSGVEDEQFGNNLIAGAIGPDGIEFTTDDLPLFNFVPGTGIFGSNCMVTTSLGGGLGVAPGCSNCDGAGTCYFSATSDPNDPGFSQVRAAWDAGARVVNGAALVPNQAVDLGGTDPRCVADPSSTVPSVFGPIPTCDFGACNAENPIGSGQTGGGLCYFNRDRFVQVMDVVTCGDFDDDASCSVSGKQEITANGLAIAFWLVRPLEDRQRQCQLLSRNAYFSNNTSRPIGLNSEGLCVELRIGSEAIVAGNSLSREQAAGLIDFFQSVETRPAGAFEEPTDLTQLDALLQQANTPPARPPYANSLVPNGPFFETAGQDKFVKEHKQVYSNLDLDFRESELIWEFGASQKQREFREGYLEFEMLDGELFARLGKLLVVWGKTELFRNQDRLNPVDIGFGTFSALEESRIGQWAAQVIYSPEWAMQLGPFEDLRIEGVMIFDSFTPQDVGKCGESLVFVQVCQKSLGAMANGLLSVGLVGEMRPSLDYDGWQQYDYGVRIEGRWDRFTFSVSDFWGWDDQFYVEPIQTYARRVDPGTGGPVNIAGPIECSIRKKICDPATMKCDTDGALVPVGPDGIATPCSNPKYPNCPASGRYSGDPSQYSKQSSIEDTVPSVGNCLLFDNPTGEDAVQTMRSAAEISLHHHANQTLFHLICSLQFSADSGYCVFDLLSNVQTYGPAAQVIATGEFSPLFLPQPETMRTAVRPFAGPTGDGASSFYFANSGAQLGFTSMTSDQQSLLGCGSRWVSPCDSGIQPGAQTGEAQMKDDFPFICASGVTLLNPEACDPDTFVNGVPSTRPLVAGLYAGGVDFLNADASVLLQEFSLLKAREAGASIGTALGVALEDCPAGRIQNGQCFLPGVTLTSENPVTTDFRLEGMRFPINQYWADRGVLLFDTDPADPNVAALLNDPNRENCTPFGNLNVPFQSTDRGCTLLEEISANVERLLIALEQAGSDRVFDPPESFAELVKMTDGIVANDLQGDPYSGPDGILSLNFDAKIRDPNTTDPRAPDLWLFIANENDLINPGSDYNLARDQIKDEMLTELGISRRLRAPDGVDLPPSVPGGKIIGPCRSLGYCFQYVGDRNIPNFSDKDGNPNLDASDLYIVAALPIQVDVCPVASGCTRGATDNITIDPRILSAEQILVLQLGMTVELSAAQTQDPNGNTLVIQDGIDGDGNQKESDNLLGLLYLDTDQDFIFDLDQDGDGALDFFDDGTPGPVSDDNIFCGSGLPGDLLQAPKQYELIDEREQALIDDLGDGGLPPRSPVFCGTLAGVMAATGRTYPFKEAGGNGAVGRRSFQWHGGSQFGIFYQKRNVFGFGLDFAEDRTKSSWGIEFTWAKDTVVGNITEPSGYNLSDEYVMTVSVDRPTFINFLNPNRAFFINFQFYLQWLADYDRDENFGARPYQLDGLVTLSFFTGYFQDRLNPRMSFVWFPSSTTYGILSGLGYSWNDHFSTNLGLNYFWGRRNMARGNYFQFLRTTPYEKSEVFRGTGAVQNRDVATVTFRYTW